jgi:subtilisin family serine protease
MHNLPGDVVCIPLGGREGPDCYNCNPAVRDAINNLANAGLWIVMSAGNEGGDAAGFCPGCTNGSRIFTVGSISCARTASSFSNFSPAVVDWVAVGEDVYSTLPGGKYGTLSGTDRAVPVVAGIIHSKGAAPLSGGMVNCRGTSYRIAHR